MAGRLRQPTTSQRNVRVRLCQGLYIGFMFIWVTVVFGLAVNVGSTWLTTKNFDPTGTPLGFILQNLPVAIASGVVLLILTIAARMLSRQEKSSIAPSQLSLPTEQQRSELIHQLRNNYQRQIAESLQGTGKMALALRQRTDVVQSTISPVSWHTNLSSDNALSASKSILQSYDDAVKGILILGAPGSGKSTLLRELATDLLNRAEQDATKPIPVIVNLSSWAIKKLPLTTWLVDALQREIPRSLSQAWIEQNHLLPLLDGLHEVESSARTSCIEAINAYRGERFISLVVCSRNQEYLAQEGRLGLPLAVEVQPLTPEQIDISLEDAGEPMAAVHAALKSNTMLYDLVTTPLMLSVVMQTYRGKKVTDLPQLGPVEDQQRQIFEHYVTRVLEQPTRKWHFSSLQTQKWLIWLALQMKQHRQTEFYVERLYPTWLPTKRSQKFYNILFWFIVGSAFWLVIGSIVVMVSAGLSGLGNKLSIETIFGQILPWLPLCLIVELIIGLAGAPQEIRPQDLLTWSWKKFWSGQKRIQNAAITFAILGFLSTITHICRTTLLRSRHRHLPIRTHTPHPKAR